MKCTIPEISWHNRDPILSVDIQQNSDDRFIRLATAGADYHVLIWQVLINESSKTNLEAISDLTRHQRPVNIVRWSPSGQYLASGDDDANIIVWQLKTDNIPSLDGETNDKETWIVLKILRGHKEDVYDLCWSPDNLKLVSGSIDNTAIIWNLGKGKNEHIFAESKGFVQGVSWDPKNQYIALLSSDRVCRVADCLTKQIKSKSFKGHLPVPESHSLYEKEVKYFHDDTFKSFFRRLSFSPDGNLLVAPSGCIESEDCRRYLNATYLYTMDSLSKPAAVLPLTKQSSIAVRFCPVFFELRPDGPKPFVDLPYRMIFAVATDNDVILYDTQQMTPFAVLQRIHYTRLTDLTWSADGTLLIASSTDGFCTIVTFDKGELGLPYVLEESEPEESILDVAETEEKEKKVEKPATINILQVKRKKVEDVKPKKPNLLENWAIKNNCSKEKGSEEHCKTLNGEECKPIEEKERINILQPKRKKIEKEGSSEEASTERCAEENGKTLGDNDCKIVEKKSEKINILQPKRKKTEETTSIKLIATEESSEKLKEDKSSKEKPNTINVLQSKKKKTEQMMSSELIIVEDASEELEEKMKTKSKSEENPKKINILQPRRKHTSPEETSGVLKKRNAAEKGKILNDDEIEEKEKNVETTSSQAIGIEEASEELEENKTKSKSKKIHILQPRKVHISSEEADKTLKDKKCATEMEKSKKVNILQPRRKKTEQKQSSDKSKANEIDKKSKEENSENSKPRKSNILEQWALKRPKK